LDNQELAQQVAAVIARHTQVVETLLALLEAEAAALAAGRGQELEKIVEAKLVQLGCLADMERRDLLALGDDGTGRDGGGLAALLDAAVPGLGPELSAHWERLRSLTRRASSRNAANGALLLAARDYTECALAVLQAQPSESYTYSPKGSVPPRRGGRSHSLATA
jgi:flagellar biosynthesis/type III secretory pathway chaperone